MRVLVTNAGFALPNRLKCHSFRNLDVPVSDVQFAMALKSEEMAVRRQNFSTAFSAWKTCRLSFEESFDTKTTNRWILNRVASILKNGSNSFSMATV